MTQQHSIALENERLKALLTRAADLLSCYVSDGCALIRELRQAAAK